MQLTYTKGRIIPPQSSEIKQAKCAQSNLQLWGPPLWSSGQNSLLQIQRPRVLLPALPDFLRSGGQPTEDEKLR
jgi:hypothetical protein